jgi:hypothetical protein
MTEMMMNKHVLPALGLVISVVRFNDTGRANSELIVIFDIDGDSVGSPTGLSRVTCACHAASVCRSRTVVAENSVATVYRTLC